MPTTNQMDIRAVTGVDRLGRKLPLAGEVPALRKDRYVGVFYFLCLDQQETDGPYDVEKILAQDPTAATNENHPLWGRIDGASHHWGEPLFGYYFTRDEWVIRKHIEMLAFADVDFLVFDTTNRYIYKDSACLIMRLLHEYVQAGYKVPRVAFMTNTLSGETVDEIYKEIYAPGCYPDTWFLWEGKPLIIGVPEQCCPEAQSFFTFRISQWPNEAQHQDGFPWMEFIRPQRVFRTRDGQAEVINVSVAQHPNCAHSDGAFFGEKDAWGRSYHHGAMDVRYRAVDWGFNAEEQWEYAIRKDPKIIFLTGWNEWTAGRWSWDRAPEMEYTVSNEEGDTVHYVRSSRPHIRHTFCDCCNEEYSRDVEPMKGGYFDNYYMQMIGKIRQFKGMPDMPADETREGWSQGITYKDYPYGNAHRACRGFGPNYYENTTGVNDILDMEVSSCKETIRFTATCAQDIVRTGSWMRLYLHVGTEQSWSPCGYEFIANFGTTDTPASADTWLARWNGETFVPLTRVPMTVEGRTVTLLLPKKDVGLAEDAPLSLTFKWADQVGDDGTVEDFYLKGDTAPYGRLSYRYQTT